MEIEKVIEDCASNMKKALAHLESELSKIRAGKASPNMLDGIMVDYYGMQTPISGAANVSNVDARTLTIAPFEKNMLAVIERAIMASNIGVTPQNDGILIRIFMPPLTEERRKEFVKRSNAEGEAARVAVRNIRRDALEQIKKAQKDGLSEDAAKGYEEQVQKTTDKHISLVEQYCNAKEKELMTV
jgi:ribosome recycling factor